MLLNIKTHVSIIKIIIHFFLDYISKYAYYQKLKNELITCKFLDYYIFILGLYLHLSIFEKNLMYRLFRSLYPTFIHDIHITNILLILF